jgi:hypothetical protein
VFLQKTDVPGKITYHKTTEENNINARSLTRKSLQLNDCKAIFESTVMMEPNLWQKYLALRPSKDQIGIVLNFRIPTNK